MSRETTRRPPDPQVFGRNGARVAAHLALVERMTARDLERLAAAQRSRDAVAFYLAWHGIYRASMRDQMLAFQAVVAHAYGSVDRRLAVLRAEFSPDVVHAVRLAVAGRALAVFAAPDLGADQTMILSGAWTHARG